MVRRWNTAEEVEGALHIREERLKTFFEDSRDVIYSTDENDLIVTINDAGLALLGLADRLDLVGRPFSDLVVSPEDRRLFLSKIRRQGLVSEYECVLRKGDGSPLFCLETARSIFDERGTFVEIQGILKDVTAQVRSQRELWRTNLELAEANSKLKSAQMLLIQHEKLASIGQLSAGVAHEINNPLAFLKSNHASMRAFLDTIEGAWREALEQEPESLKEIGRRHELDYVFAEARSLGLESEEGFSRIVEIVGSLRNFARSDFGGGTALYDLNKGIESTLVVARNEIQFVADVELDLSPLPLIRAGGGAINQVILNLLVNAAQAIEGQGRTGKGRIRVSTRQEKDDVCMEISDDGPGIPEESRLVVFDPFFTTKAPGKGTGLGLSISYDIIVRKHAGSMTLLESPLGGACFTIMLPINGSSGLQEEAP